MKGVKLHVKILAGTLLLLGAISVAWQLFVANIPVSSKTPSQFGSSTPSSALIPGPTRQ